MFNKSEMVAMLDGGNAGEQLRKLREQRVTRACRVRGLEILPLRSMFTGYDGFKTKLREIQNTRNKDQSKMFTAKLLEEKSYCACLGKLRVPGVKR